MAIALRCKRSRDRKKNTMNSIPEVMWTRYRCIVGSELRIQNNGDRALGIHN